MVRIGIVGAGEYYESPYIEVQGCVSVCVHVLVCFYLSLSAMQL